MDQRIISVSFNWIICRILIPVETNQHICPRSPSDAQAHAQKYNECMRFSVHMFTMPELPTHWNRCWAWQDIFFAQSSSKSQQITVFDSVFVFLNDLDPDFADVHFQLFNWFDGLRRFTGKTNRKASETEDMLLHTVRPQGLLSPFQVPVTSERGENYSGVVLCLVFILPSDLHQLDNSAASHKWHV